MPIDRRTVMAGAAAALGLASRTAADPVALAAGGWDHVIVGAGSAGCVLANRLSADPHVRVLLIEAGPAATDPAVLTPGAWPTLQGGANDWAYRSTPQAGLGGRILAQPRGKGLGGSTLINALGFQRGPHEAYDAWGQATGDPGWGFAGLLPYFRKLETASGGADRWRGGEGPLHILQVGGVADRNPASAAFAAAGIAAGHPLNPDWNGARADGTIWTQLTMRDGRRDTAASAWLDPVRGRPNLTVATGLTVTGLRLDKTRCVGVEAGGAFIATAREVILSAGAIDSPRLLMVSGIGPAAMLRAAGVAVRHDLPGVGAVLQDHPLAPGFLWQARRPIPASHYNHSETMVVAESSRSPGRADIQLMGLTVPYVSPDLGAAPGPAFAVVPALTHVRSRGSLTLVPGASGPELRIDPAYLTDAADVAALVDAAALARDVMAGPALRDWIEREIFPGPTVRDDTAMAAHVRRVASPFYHPAVTCRMGRADDAMAVVDPRCRVRGLDGLRVVDASILPSLPQAMPNAAILAVAERAAEIIAPASP